MPFSLEGYRIEEKIGEGGMGVVYKATHLKRNSPVALKVLHSHLARDTTIVSRFRTEAQIMKRLDHPNLVKLYDFIEDSNCLVLVMEYVNGGTLDNFIGKKVGPIPYEKAIPLFGQMLDAVSEVHKHGILHRDIKPSNIILTKDDTVKVTDFGIAKVAGNTGVTSTGTMVGTLFYMSPEQIKGEVVDKRSDLYSLGVTFYEMLSGNMPYSTTTTDFQIMHAIANENLPDPRLSYPHIPDWVVAAMYKAVQKKKSKRFSTCMEFKDYLLNHLRSESTNSMDSSYALNAAPVLLEKCRECGSILEADYIYCTVCGKSRN